MQVKDLVKALLEHYPPNAEVLATKPTEATQLGGYAYDISPVTEILYDEKRNTIELVAD